jgi:hypothetical protein
MEPVNQAAGTCWLTHPVGALPMAVLSERAMPNEVAQPVADTVL